MSVHAYMSIAPSLTRSDNRLIKSSRSLLFRNIRFLSIPRPITWCKTPGASNLANLGIASGYRTGTKHQGTFCTNVPSYCVAALRRGFTAAGATAWLSQSPLFVFARLRKYEKGIPTITETKNEIIKVLVNAIKKNGPKYPITKNPIT